MKNHAVEKKVRSSNMELLRVISMLMIVIYHIVCHCVNVQLHGGDATIKISSDLFNYPYFYKRLYLLSGIMKWGPIGNTIFILISGYFMVEKGKNINIISIARKLITELAFAAVALVLVSNIAVVFCNDIFISALSFDFNNMSWYVGYYFTIIACAFLCLNEYLLSLSYQKYTIFLVILFSTIEFSWSNSIIDGIGWGLGTLLLGIFLYSFGGYIKKYEPFKNIRFLVFVILIVCVNLIEYISYYNLAKTAIESFDFSNPDAVFNQTILSYGNRDLVILVVAVCIFEIFKRVSMPNSKIINFMGMGTFMVYLVHDNAFFYSIWGLKNWVLDLYNTPWLFLLDLFKLSVATFITGIMAYIAYAFTCKMLKEMNWIFLNNRSLQDE